MIVFLIARGGLLFLPAQIDCIHTATGAHLPVAAVFLRRHGFARGFFDSQLIGLTQWGFGGGKPPSKIPSFRHCRATKSPDSAGKKDFWSAFALQASVFGR